MGQGILNVDVKFWIFLQNVINLPSDFLKQSEEYDLFKTANEYGATFSISEYDILDDYSFYFKTNEYYKFATFGQLIVTVKEILELYELQESKKYKLLIEAIPKLEVIALENTLENLTINLSRSE